MYKLKNVVILSDHNSDIITITSNSPATLLRAQSLVMVGQTDTLIVKIDTRARWLNFKFRADFIFAVFFQGAKLWGGRFTDSVDPLLEKFNESLSYDKRMWEADIAVSMSHCNYFMLRSRPDHSRL